MSAASILEDFGPGRLTERVAGYVRSRIQAGIFWPGDRVPSVRELSRQLSVSVTTVVDAYRILETQGLLSPREKSGYFVRLAAVQTLRRKPLTQPAQVPLAFERDAFFVDALNEPCSHRSVQLATANPNVDLLPREALVRLLRSCAREAPEEILSYGSIAGYRPLREQIARRSMASGCTLSPDEITVTAGASEALSLCLRTICQPGDIIAIESPAYYGVLGACRAHGLRILEIPTDPLEGVCPDSLEQAINLHDVKAVILTPNYNNPFGALMPIEAKRQIVEMLAAREIPLVEDDVYGDLGYDDERPVNAKAFDETGNVLLCSSVSKTIAPGYRVGWVAGGRYHREILIRKFSSSCTTATLPQMAIAEFFARQRFTYYVRRAATQYQQNIREMTRAVEEAFPAGTHCSTPLGGFVLWVEMPPGYDAVELYQRARQEGIIFMPGLAFTTQDAYQNCLRLNAGRWDGPTADAVAKLGAMARSARTT